MITSITNSRMKRLRQLQEKAKERDRDHVFIVEGVKMFLEAPIEKVKEVYVSENFLERMESDREAYAQISEKLSLISCETLSEEVFRKVSDTQSPQGILCVVEQNQFNLGDMVRDAMDKKKTKNKAPLFLILEDIQDPGNLGTMIRTGEGAGVDGIFMNKETVSIYNPKTIRSTMGSVYRVPFLYMEDLREAMHALQEQSIHVYAAHLKGKIYYHEVDYSGGSAFLIGNEGSGLKKETAVCADSVVRIPMRGKVESLNAAIAAALLMYRASVHR